jgi:transcriptional regulator with XRE-family HTH domain
MALRAPGAHTDPMSLAARLRSARLAAGFGVRELARRAGRPESYADISRIESAQQLHPSADKLGAYATALGVSLEWLIDGSAPPGSAIVSRLVTAHPSRWSAAAIAAATQLEADTRTAQFWEARLDDLDAAVTAATTPQTG